MKYNHLMKWKTHDNIKYERKFINNNLIKPDDGISNDSGNFDGQRPEMWYLYIISFIKTMEVHNSTGSE